MTITEPTTAAVKSTAPSAQPAAKAAAKPVVKSGAKKVAAKPPAKTPSKTVAKTAPVVTKKTAPKVAAKAPVPKPVAAKPAKEKKVKLVRDSFTMPKLEFMVVDALKLRAAKLAVPVKKTELIRAGIKALAAMNDAAFLSAVRAVPNLKTGRPVKAR